MWYNIIQHHTTRNAFYLHNFTAESDLKYWTEFFEERMTAHAMLEQYEASYPQENIKIWLKCHQVNDVFRFVTRESTQVSSNLRNIALHLELEDSMIALGETYLSVILKCIEFKSMYWSTFLFVLVIVKSHTEAMKERIRRYQDKHRHNMFNLENVSRGGIETLESVYQQRNRTMRQLTIKENTGDGNRLFITVGQS